MLDKVLNTPKLDIRHQIKSLLKALLDWSVVNKYFILIFFFCKTHRKTPVRGSLFSKFPGLQPKKGSSTEVFLQISANS